jgi:NADH dehydrogenase
VNAVTGALSYTGRAIAEDLLARGEQVRSLSRRDDPGDPLRSRIDLRRLAFDDSLADALAGVETLYNTYWTRFERGSASFDLAVERTIALFEAAHRAGVSRVVHVSVSKADRADDLPYFRGKHRIEQWLESSELEWSIVRPTLIFGAKDVLLNNIAWALRHLPVFLLPGRGGGLVQPISVRDTAGICVEAPPRVVVDAAGPERFDFKGLVGQLASAVGSRARILSAPEWVGLAAVRVANVAVRDVIVTRDELTALGRSLITSDEPPRGSERFSDWLAANGHELGRRYTSELRRNFSGEE